MRDLFPPGVELATASAAPGPLVGEENDLAASMSPGRRLEFQTGRDCARRALRALGVADCAIPRGERRMPLWPEGIVGAITHTEGFCAAAAAPARAWAGLGLDAEQRTALSERVVERITVPDERNALSALPGRDLGSWGAVLFSAKESLYKAYFPATGCFLGFRDAQVGLDPASGRFRARIVRGDAPDLAGRRDFEGAFRFVEGEDGAWVVTGLAIPR